MFAVYAENHADLIINDINYLSASFGLQKWSAPQDWYLYKYALAIAAIPFLSFSVSNLIKAVFGKNKKVFVLDLDNTLWDGVIGDDGSEGIELGEETSLGQAYREFQSYIKMHKDIGILLTINSKNDLENGVSGLNHPDSLLRPEDFLVIKANWNNKDSNIREISKDLNLGADSFVFVDDNMVERDIVKKGGQGVAVPEIGTVEDYITTIDQAGYFEVIELSKEDIMRNQMYKVDAERRIVQKKYLDYAEYLLSLEMTADIKNFECIYFSRIAQLTNKTNQFNLTTKRFSQSEIESVSDNDSIIKISGRLRDKFGDSGITSLVIGKLEGAVMNIELWLMSCRVLKRDFEFAMMDALVEKALKKGIKTINGYYVKTEKNKMVKDFYRSLGFQMVGSCNGNTTWKLEIDGYERLNKVIQVNN
jgi:FkbH-like protein